MYEWYITLHISSSGSNKETFYAVNRSSSNGWKWNDIYHGFRIWMFVLLKVLLFIWSWWQYLLLQMHNSLFTQTITVTLTKTGMVLQRLQTYNVGIYIIVCLQHKLCSTSIIVDGARNKNYCHKLNGCPNWTKILIYILYIII